MKEKNGKAPKKGTPEVKPQATNVWQLCREMLSAGKKDEEIKRAAVNFLLKSVDPKTALDDYCRRMAYRALRRAKISAKKGK